jgi:hypothetical protein
MIFNRRYNNPAFGSNDTMSFADLRVMSDGFVIVGHDAASSTAPRDLLLCKINLTGAMTWAMVYGETAFDEEGDSLENTSDGGFVLTGRDGAIPFPGGTRFVKTNSLGAALTSRRFAGFLSAQASLREDVHSMLVFGGNRVSATSSVISASLARTFPDGTLDAAMAYGAFTTPGMETGEAAIATTDGGYALAGRTDHFSGAQPPEKYFVKTNKCLQSGCNEVSYAWPDDPRSLPSHAITLTSITQATTIWNPNNNTGGQNFSLCLAVICIADFNCDGFTTGDDIDAFSADFDAGLITADVNGDGFMNGDDFDAYTYAFDAGC